MAPFDTTHGVGGDRTPSNSGLSPLLNEVQNHRQAGSGFDFNGVGRNFGDTQNLPSFSMPSSLGQFGRPGPGSPSESHPVVPPPDNGAGRDDGTQGNIADKLGREGVVVGGGVGKAFVYGLANLPEKLPQIGTSIAIGAGLSAISKTGQLGLDAAFVVGAYFGCKFLLNTIHDTARWTKLGSAVSDAWHSNKHVMKDLNDFADSGGEFAFNTSLSMASGYVGYKDKKLGDLIISILRIPPVVPAEVATSALLFPSMCLDIIPPMYYKHEGQDGRGGPSTKWSFDVNVRGSVNKTVGQGAEHHGADRQDSNSSSNNDQKKEQSGEGH